MVCGFLKSQFWHFGVHHVGTLKPEVTRFRKKRVQLGRSKVHLFASYKDTNLSPFFKTHISVPSHRMIRQECDCERCFVCNPNLASSLISRLLTQLMYTGTYMHLLYTFTKPCFLSSYALLHSSDKQNHQRPEYDLVVLGALVAFLGASKSSLIL